jgi:hypothetical protein
MKVEIYEPGVNKDNRGNFCLWYGKSGVGKTATVLQTAADPIVHIIAERGQEHLTIQAINRPDIKLITAYYEGWDDCLDYLQNIDNFKGIKTLLFCSLTHVMNIRLKDEILEENHEARTLEARVKKQSLEKELTNRVKGTPEMYGALSNQMFRLMTAFEQLTIAGVDVHCTARDDSMPKWDRSLSCAPALAGKEFPRDMKGAFDFIGLIESNINSNGLVSYPPLVSCDDNGSYVSKWTGVKPEGGVIRKPFNVAKMLEVAHGLNGKEK